MVDEPDAPPSETTTAEPVPPPTRPRAARARKAKTETAPVPVKEEAKPAVPETKTPRIPRRAEVDDKTAQALRARRLLDQKRPRFVRQAAHRYQRIGRDQSWRRPRGLQSKQRRHYGYRPAIVRVGYRTPVRARGLVPSGFRPILVETTRALEQIDPLKEAAILARGIGTRRRLVLEEAARRLGIRVLNPIATPEAEE